MGIANSFIADWDAKFHYNFWRPLTAIRNGDMDSNDATERDAGWTPLNATPMQRGGETKPNRSRRRS